MVVLGLRLNALIIFAVLVIVLLLKTPTRAATATWDGGGSDRHWSIPENWTDDVVPEPAHDLHVQLQADAARYNPLVDLHEPWTLNRLTISNRSYNVSGNTLRFAGEDAWIAVGGGPDGHGYAFSCPLELADDLTIEMKQSYNFYMDGAVSGVKGVTVTGGGAGTARRGHFRKEATYQGQTRLFGWFTLAGSEGRIINSSSIEIYPNAALILASGGTGAATNRVTDSIPVYHYGGPLYNDNVDETLDEIIVMGGLGYLQANAGILRIGHLVRHKGGSARIRGPATLGMAGGPRLFIGAISDTAPVDLLVGGNGATGSTTVSIIPFIHADDTFTTYDEADGFRRLDLATEYVEGLPTAGPFDNVVQTNSVALAVDTAINALALRSYSMEISGDHTLRLNSGALLTAQNTRNQKITCSLLDFAGREACITVHNTGGYSTALAISSVITNASGLTFAGTHGYSTASSPLTLSGASVYTGRTAVLVGKLILQSGDNRLPVSTWVSLGYGAQLLLNNVNQTVAGVEGLGNINISASTRTLTVSNVADFILGGAVTGAGGLAKMGAGVQTLAGACTYAGETIVSSGTLCVNGTLAPAAGTVTIYPDGILAGTGTISRAILVAGGTLSPGVVGGTLTVASNITFAADSTLAVTIGSGGANLIACGAAVALDGTLTVSMADGFQPIADQEWEIITAADGISGSFAVRNVPGLAVELYDNRVVLRYPGQGTAILMR